MPLDPKAMLAKNKMLLNAAHASKGELELKFAMAVDKDPKKTVVWIEKLGQPMKLMNQLKKDHPANKGLSCGTLTVVDDDGGTAVVITLEKKLGQAPRKISDALKRDGLHKFKNVRLQSGEDEDEDEEATEGQGGAPGPQVAARGRSDDDDDDDDADSDDDDDAATGRDAKSDADDEGDEDQDQEQDADDGAPPPAPPAPKPAGATLAAPTLVQLRKISLNHRSVTSSLVGGVNDLQSKITAHYSNQPPEFQAALKDSLGQLQRVVEKLNHKLALALDKACEATDPKQRQLYFKAVKALTAELITFVSTDQMCEHLKNNPWGVDLDIKGRVISHCKDVAKALPKDIA